MSFEFKSLTRRFDSIGFYATSQTIREQFWGPHAGRARFIVLELLPHTRSVEVNKYDKIFKNSFRYFYGNIKRIRSIVAAASFLAPEHDGNSA